MQPSGPSASHPRVYGYLASEKKKVVRANKELQQQRVALLAWGSAHKTAITEFVTEYGLEPDEEFHRRSGGKMLMAALQPGDTVVAAKFCRLFGAPEDAHATLTSASARGVHFRALDVGDGRPNLEQSRSLLAVLLAVSATYSRYGKKLAARQVKQREAGAGRYRGGNPEFGSIPAERQHVAMLLELRNAGASFRKLEQVSKQAGFSLSHTGIKKIFDRMKSFRVAEN